jgi:hypothetical protein
VERLVMPKRVTLERVTGVVALSYLILIPGAALVAYQKVKDLESDLDQLWDKTMPAGEEPLSTLPLRERVRRVLRGR